MNRIFSLKSNDVTRGWRDCCILSMAEKGSQAMRMPFLRGQKGINEHPPKTSALTHWSMGFLAWGFILAWFGRKWVWVVVVGVVFCLIAVFLSVLEWLIKNKY
jgi:hypothetical protein